MTTEQPTQDHQPQAAAPAFTLVPAPTQMVESFYPPTVAIPSTTKPEEINWLGPPLLSELEALPKPDRMSDTPPILENKFNEVFSAVATRREWYNIYQFFQFCMSAMVPWGYEVKLSNDHRFVHCLPNAEACAVSPYDIHFNFIKKTYQLSRARPECASNTSEKMEFYAQKRKAAAAASVGVNGVSSIAKKQRPEAPTKTLFDVQWNSIYERLKKYREKYGNCCVPTRGYEDPQLAKWVSRQREYHNKGTLSQERIDKLNALGFSWRLKDKDTGKGPTSDSTWEKNFNRLKAYREKFGKFWFRCFCLSKQKRPANSRI